jgi:hypothetical protein
VTLCAVCTVHEEMRTTGFLVEPQNQGRRFDSGLPGFLVEPQNHWDGLSVVWPQNHLDGFSWFSLKTSGDGFSRFGLKTGGDGFSWFGLKIGGGGYPDLGIKTKWASVCRLRLKTNGRMKTVWDTLQDPAACFTWKRVGLGFPSCVSKLVEERRRMVHVASSRRSRGCETKDGSFDGVGCTIVEVVPNYP